MDALRLLQTDMRPRLHIGDLFPELILSRSMASSGSQTVLLADETHSRPGTPDGIFPASVFDATLSSSVARSRNRAVGMQ
jgi:hypothetical protein